MAARSPAPSAASTAPRAWEARSSRCSRPTATSTAPSCSPSASARQCTRRSWRATRARSLTISFGISTFPLHGQSADGLLAHRRPGPLRRQAPRPQPLGDIERRGARHPRPRAAARGRRLARGARRAAQPRRGARRARLGERLALPQGRPLRRADRARARAVARGRRARAARRDPSRRGPRGRPRAICCRRTGRSPTTSGCSCAPIRWSARAWSRRPSTTTSAPGSCSTTSAPTAPATPRGGASRDVPLESSIIARGGRLRGHDERSPVPVGARLRRTPATSSAARRDASSAPTWSTRCSGPSDPYGLPL